MSTDPQSKEQQEQADKNEILQKYAPDVDKIDLDLSGTETAQPNVSPEVMAQAKAEEKEAVAEFAEARSPDLEFIELDFLHDQESEDEREFRVKFRQVVLAGYAEGRSFDDVYKAVEAIQRSPAVDTRNLPLRDIARRIWNSAEQSGDAARKFCHICGKYNPRYEDNCPSFCPYSEAEGQS